MKTKTIYRSSITGKKYAEANPDTTQKETLHICNLRDELLKYSKWLLKDNSNAPQSLVDEYLSK